MMRALAGGAAADGAPQNPSPHADSSVFTDVVVNSHTQDGNCVKAVKHLLFVFRSVPAESSSGGGDDGLGIARLTSYMIFNYGARGRETGGGAVAQLSLLLSGKKTKPTSVPRNVAPSTEAFLPVRSPTLPSPPPTTPPHPTRDGQVRVCPAPSVIKRPSCAVTSGGAEAGVIRDPVPAPSEDRGADLDRAAEGKATHGISMKDVRASSPPRKTPGRAGGHKRHPRSRAEEARPLISRVSQ